MPTGPDTPPDMRHSSNMSSQRFRLSPYTPGIGCTYDVPFDISMGLLSVMYISFGIVYAFFGYRCFRASNFLTGFTFATIIVYIICIQEYLMPHWGNVIVAMVAGLLFGLITTLIQYVGLFMNGIHVGLIVAVVGLAIYDHLLTVFPTTYWLCIATLSCSAIFFGALNIFWKKGLFVFGTAIYGAALFAIAVDYFFERLEMLKWVWSRAKLEPVVAPPCRLTWLFLAIWPAVSIVGITAQWLITGTGTFHEISLRSQARRLAARNKRPLTREQREELKEKKYRYLYSVRTAHGDVISQSFLNALQKKPDQNTDVNWMERGAGESSTLQSDSTHLTALAGSDHHQESDDDINNIRHNMRAMQCVH